MKPLIPVVALALVAGSGRAAETESLATAARVATSPKVVFGGVCSGSSTTIYDTTHISSQGAEITAAANGAATAMGDLITLAAGDRFVCGITVEMFTLAAVTPFDLTLTMWTDCTTSGAGNSPCGNGTGTLIPGSTVTVTGVTPPSLGTIFPVTFDYPTRLNLTSEVDNTVTVSINASRSDVFWRLGETVTVGAQPDAGTSFVQRCGSTAANNGCSRNFGVTNNFAITIQADATPVELLQLTVD